MCRGTSNSPVGTQPNHNAMSWSAYIPSGRDIKKETAVTWIKPRCKCWLGGWLNKAWRNLGIRSLHMPLVFSYQFKVWALLQKARSVSHFANDKSLLRICVEWVWNDIQLICLLLLITSLNNHDSGWVVEMMDQAWCINYSWVLCLTDFIGNLSKDLVYKLTTNRP